MKQQGELLQNFLEQLQKVFTKNPNKFPNVNRTFQIICQKGTVF